MIKINESHYGRRYLVAYGTPDDDTTQYMTVIANSKKEAFEKVREAEFVTWIKLDRFWNYPED